MRWPWVEEREGGGKSLVWRGEIPSLGSHEPFDVAIDPGDKATMLL